MKKWFNRDTLVVIAALALLASVVTGRERPTMALIEPQPRQVQKLDADIDISKLERKEEEKPANDPFAARSFESGNPVQTARTQPSAPPLPFRYFGKVIEDGKLEIFVMNGDETLSLKKGAKVGDYRVDKVSEQSITFTYLPLNTRQTLDIPAVN